MLPHIRRPTKTASLEYQVASGQTRHAEMHDRASCVAQPRLCRCFLTCARMRDWGHACTRGVVSAVRVHMRLCLPATVLLRIRANVHTYTQTRQASQVKKKWRGEGRALLFRMCSPLPICMLVVVVALFLFMGSFYGVGCPRSCAIGVSLVRCPRTSQPSSLSVGMSRRNPL
jgi:hypothetical protein